MDEKWLLIKNMLGGYEIVPESQEYRFGFYSQILGVFDSREKAESAAPDSDEEE